MAIKYTTSQIRAIGHTENNLLIIACAGSGKTEVISKRIAELVRNGIEKSQVVAFTFTDRAAAELKTRIRQHLEEVMPSDPALGDMFVGTIHSFCLQMLKEVDPQYRSFDVIDEEQQVAFIASNFYELRLNVLQNQQSLRWFQTIERFLNTLNFIHLENVNSEDLDDDLKTSVNNYYDFLKTVPNHFLDFNLIINEFIDTLDKNEEIRNTIRDRFKYIVVDEYQDIDPRQEELIQLLIGNTGNLCVVGDDDQAIYGWRGADVNNILTFEQRYQNVTRINMVDNFRSTHAITEIANRTSLSLSERLEKDMDAVHWESIDGQDQLRETMANMGDIHKICFNSREEEAVYIVDKIEYLRGVGIEAGCIQKGIDWADIAVLYRSVRNYAGPLVDELRRRNIPFVVKGARGLFTHDETRLVLAAFHLIANVPLMERDENNRFILLDEEELRERIRQLINTLNEARLVGANYHRFLEWISEKRRDIELANLPRDQRPANVSRRVYPQDIFHDIMFNLGASQNDWDELALYNLGRFSSLLTKYEAVHQWLAPRDLRKLLRYLDGWALTNVKEGGPDEFLTLNAVQILTIHAAKGLEWPVVFIPSVFSRHFPSSMRNRGIETFITDADSDRYVTGDDGERRLLYVALTRSKKFLNVTSVTNHRIKPTPFYNELIHNYIVEENIDKTDRERLEPVPPINAELLPTTFSDLNYYWHCPYDYKLRRLMGFGPRIGQEFGYGQQIHNLLSIIHEQAMRGKILDEDDLSRLTDNYFNLRYTTGEPLENMKNAAKKTVNNYINFAGEQLPQMILQAEKPFEFVLEEALINGTIDLLERIDESTGSNIPVGVIDFKTGIDEEADVFQRRLADAKNQVVLYSIAARKALNLDPQIAAVHFLDHKDQRREEVNVNDTEQERLRNNVAETVRNIKASYFPKAPSHGSERCKSCDHKKFCPGLQN